VTIAHRVYNGAYSNVFSNEAIMPLFRTKSHQEHVYSRKAAKTKTPAELYNIGKNWTKGTFGKIDQKQALLFLEAAWSRGYLPAAAAIVDVWQDDPRYHANGRRQKRAVDMLIKAAVEDDVGARFKLASEWIRLPDFSTSEEMYQRLSSGDKDGQLATEYEVKAALALGFRHMLGLRVEQNWASACNLLQRACASGQKLNVLSEEIHQAKTAIAAMQHWRVPDSRASAKICEVHAGGPGSAGQWFSALREGAGSSSEDLVELAAVANLLHQIEGLPFEPFPWCHVVSALDCRLLGSKWELCEQSSREFGPFYNEMAMLMPRLGVVKPGLAQGFGSFLGLEGTRSGELHFHFEAPSDPAGPLLCEEDINVALALAFGSAKPVMPFVSVEPIQSKVSGRDRSLYQKLWEPTWVGRTLLGKTLFGVDHWAAKLLEAAPTWLMWMGTGGQSMTEEGKAFLERIRDCGGDHVGKAGRVMIHPESFYRTWTATDDSHRCQVHKLEMRILGANVVERPDGTIDRDANRNDERFYAGRAANLVTREYDNLARLMPIFERMRQLTSLLYGLKELRERGFEPNSQLRENISKTLREFADGGSIPLANRLAL
jgi:hypothetical protein